MKPSQPLPGSTTTGPSAKKKGNLVPTLALVPAEPAGPMRFQLPLHFQAPQPQTPFFSTASRQNASYSYLTTGKHKKASFDGPGQPKEGLVHLDTCSFLCHSDGLEGLVCPPCFCADGDVICNSSKGLLNWIQVHQKQWADLRLWSWFYPCRVLYAPFQSQQESPLS